MSAQTDVNAFWKRLDGINEQIERATVLLHAIDLMATSEKIDPTKGEAFSIVAEVARGCLDTAGAALEQAMGSAREIGAR